MTEMKQQDFEIQSTGKRTVFGHSWLPAGTEVENIVVLIHGLGEHLGRYNNWAQKFCDVKFGVYALDLAGHGRSSGKRGHIDKFEDLFRDITSLVDIAQSKHPKALIHLYGHSMGGTLVLGTILSHNLELATIITTGPAIAPGFEPPSWKIALAKFLDGFVPGLLLGNELDVEGISRDPAVVQAYKNDPLVHSKISVRWFNEWLRCVEKIKQNAKKINRPLLILHAGEDRLTSSIASESLAMTISPRATFKRWPNAFHELHNEPDKNDVFDFVIKWISTATNSAS